MDAHAPDPTGVGPMRGARGRPAPNPSGLGCPKCRDNPRGCKQCQKWLEEDPSRAWGNNAAQQQQQPPPPPDPVPTPQQVDNAMTVDPPQAAASGPVDPSLLERLVANEAQADDGDEIAAQEAQDAQDAEDAAALAARDDDDDRLFNTVADDRSALMVVCDPSFAQQVKYDQLTEDEKKTADQWFEKEMKDRAQRNESTDDAEKATLLNQTATNVRNKMHKNLPAYKCVARPFSEREAEEMYARRVAIDKAWRGEADDDRQRGAAMWLDEISTALARHGLRTLASDAELLQREYDEIPCEVSFDIVQGELNARLARLSLDTLPTKQDQDRMWHEFDAIAKQQGLDTDTVMSDYLDFMNEERLRLLQTVDSAIIRAVREGGPNATATAADLDAQLEQDELVEATRLFNGTPLPTGAAAQPQGFQPIEKEQLVMCKDVPRIEFFPDPPHKKWNETPWFQNNQNEEQARLWCLQHADNTWQEVPTQSLHNNCQPIQRWPFPYRDGEGEPFKPGMWQAFKRTRELRNELGLAKTGNISSKWVCTPTFLQDPLVRVVQRRTTEHPRDVTLFRQLLEEHGDKCENSDVKTKVVDDHKFSVNSLAIELLRCYPVLKQGTELNSLIEFACWWHVNLRTNTAALEHHPKKKLKGKKTEVSPQTRENEKMKLLYDLQCAPDLQEGGKLLVEGMRHDAELPEGLHALRGNVHGRMRIVMIAIEGLFDCLFEDVFRTDPNESVLLRGGNLHHKAERERDEARAAARAAKGRVVQAWAEYEAGEDEWMREPFPDGVDPATVTMPPALVGLKRRAQFLESEYHTLDAIQTNAQTKLDGTSKPSQDDIAAGQALYNQWKAMHPLRDP